MALLSVNSVIVGYACVMAEHAVRPRTLGEVKRVAVIDHILAAARHLVLSAGLNATMDQIAEESGVSRRTLFRHFATRERLLAAAFDAGMAGYRDGLPVYDGDLEGWLRQSCQAAHRMNSTIGPGFFELASRTDLAPDLVDVENRRRHEFRAAAAQIASTLWTALGADGPVPHVLDNAVAAHLSPFFTAATTIDADHDWQTAADLAYAAILATATSLVAPDGADLVLRGSQPAGVRTRRRQG